MSGQTYPIKIIVSADGKALAVIENGIKKTVRATEELADKTEKTSAKSVAALKAVSAELGNLFTKYQSLARGAAINITARLNTKRALQDLAAFQALAKSKAITIDARLNSQAAGALAQTTAATYALTSAVTAGLMPLKAYSQELEQLAQNAKDAAKALNGASGAAGRGISGNVSSRSNAGGDESALRRRHALAVYGVTQRYAALAAQLLVVKTAMAALTATAVSAVPVLAKMATVAGAAFGTALATANVNAATKEMQKLTETTGASAEGLQKWRLAARFEGVGAALNEFGDMGAVFSDLSAQMDKLGTESGKDFADGLKLIGLSAKQIKDMKPEDALLKIGEAVAKADMSTRDKTAFLGAISDDAAKLLPLLEKNGQKIKEITEYAGKVGAIQSDAQLAAAKEANTQLSYFKVGLEGVQVQLSAVGNRVITTLAPNIKKLFVDAKAPLDNWALAVDIVLTKFKHDLDSTGSWGVAFSRMFEGMYPTLYQFLSSAGKFGKGYGEAFVTPMMDALKRGYAGISEALGKAGGAESLGAGLGAAMLPVVTIVDTVTGSIKILITNWDALKAVAAVTPVGFLAANWDSIVAVFESVGNGIRGVGEAFGLLNPETTANASGVQIFVAALGALLVSGAASRLVLGAIGATFNTLSFALAPLGTALGIVATGLKALALAAVANPIGALVTAIALGATLIFTNWEKVGAFFTDLWAGVKQSASGLIDWWNNTTPKQKVLDIKAATIDVAKEKYTQFVGWLNNTTPKQKVVDIATGSVSIAKSVIGLFISTWNNSPLKPLALELKTAALDYAERKANEFSAWWSSWTLKSVVADVTADGIIWAWETAKSFSAWVYSWILPKKDVALDFSIIEVARNAIKGFMNWISTIEFKLPEIKLPNIAAIGANVGAKLRKVGGDIADGLAEGMNRATSHIKAAESVAGAIEPTMRNVVQSRSPSKITEAIGADTAAGLGLGIEKGASGVKKAAEKTANASVDAFKSVMDGLQKQVIGLTQGDEAARRFELTQQKIVGANQNIVISTEAHIKALEAQKTKVEETKSAAEQAAKAYTDMVSQLKGQIVTLTQGDEAGRRYELTQQKVTGANQENVISLQNQIKALEAQKTKVEETKSAAEQAAKAYTDMVSQLKGQIVTLTQGDEAGRRYELTQQKVTGANQENVISLQNQIKALEAQKTKQEEAKTALDAARKAQTDASQALKDATAGLGLNDEALRALTLSHTAGYNPAMAASQAADEAKTKALNELRDAQNRAREAIEASEKSLKIAQQSINMTDQELRALTLSYEKGYTKAMANSQAATEAQAKALQDYRTDIQALHKEQQILEARLYGGEDAARAMELSLKDYNDEQIRGIMLDEARIQSLQNMASAASGIGDAIADGLFSGNWKQASQDILGQLDNYFVKPLKNSLSQAISQALSIKGGLFDSVGSLLNIGGLKTALGGVGSSVGTLFSGIAASAANGFAGIGTAISGGLSGIMGSFGTLVSAIPVWGWALAGVAGLAKLFGGPSAPKIRLTQGATDGQGMLTDGQQHFTKTALGTVGATDDSYKIGRAKGFVPKLHEWFKWVESFDAMVAKTLPNSIGAISEALKGVEMKGANLEAFTRQRLHIIFSALPEALQVAIQGGKNIMSGTTEEIAARFTYMAQVADSGLIPALQQLGLVGTQSKESMIALAMGLADAMGGIDAAKAALDNYYNTAYTDAERLALTQNAAKTKLDEYNKSLGLSGSQYIDTVAKLRARIEAEDASTAAGQKNIATLLSMVDAIKTLSGTAEEAAAKLKGQWDDFNNAAYTDAQREAIAKKQAQKLVDQFNQTYGTSLANIIDARQLMRTIDTTTDAGKKMQQSLLGITGSLVTLGGTAEQIKQKIAGLKEGIKGLVSNLYGSSATSLGSSSTSTVDSNQAALSAAQATLDSLRNQQNAEQERISSLNEAANDAYQSQLDNYRTLADAAKSLLDLARGFADESQDAAAVLKSAQLDYNATLRAARAGDVEAAQKLGDTATRLKAALGSAYNNDDRAASGIKQIEDQLRSTSGILTSLAGSEPTKPADIASTVLASLEQQIKAQESIVSNLQSLTSSTNAAANEAKATADRAAMAKELATKIGELGLSTDKIAWDILKANGINIKDLAKDFGINVDKLDGTFIKKVAELSDLLNVNSLQLLGKIGVSATELATSYGINVDKLDKTMISKLGELSNKLGVNGLEMANALGLNAKEIAAAYGLNTDKLNQNFLTKLDSLADVLRVSSVDLAGKLGINIDKLGDLMANKLAALPNIPADIKAGLAPHLQDIRNAADPATLQKELRELQTYVNSLPPGIKGQLNAQLQGILGYTGNTDTSTNDIRAPMKNVSSKIVELTAYTRDELTGQYLTGVWQNLKSLNQNAAKIGKSSIPSFAIGSDKLPGDMLANVHKGEMIFTAAQSDSMRDLALYNQRVIPQIGAYLSAISSRVAANDTQAPVFIQPVVSQSSKSGGDALLTEIKGLRDDNRALKQELSELRKEQRASQFAIANSADKSRRTLEKWDVDGLPVERTA